MRECSLLTKLVVTVRILSRDDPISPREQVIKSKSVGVLRILLAPRMAKPRMAKKAGWVHSD